MRELYTLKILKYIINEFENKNIYWFDYSGLLSLMRKRSLAELSDVDISINLQNVKSVIDLLKTIFLIFILKEYFKRIDA